MALVERLMALEEPAIAVHQFYGVVHERVSNNLTRQQVIEIFDFNAADLAEWDAIGNLAPTGGSALAEAQRAHYISRVHAVFILAEMRTPGYDTPAAVRVKLGI